MVKRGKKKKWCRHSVSIYFSHTITHTHTLQCENTNVHAICAQVEPHEINTEAAGRKLLCYWVLNGIGTLWVVMTACVLFGLCMLIHLMVATSLAAPPSLCLNIVLTRLYMELMSPLTVTRSNKQHPAVSLQRVDA